MTHMHALKVYFLTTEWREGIAWCAELDMEEFSQHSRVTHCPQQLNTYLYILSHIKTCNYRSLLCPVGCVGLNHMNQVNKWTGHPGNIHMHFRATIFSSLYVLLEWSLRQSVPRWSLGFQYRPVWWWPQHSPELQLQRPDVFAAYPE